MPPHSLHCYECIWRGAFIYHISTTVPSFFAKEVFLGKILLSIFSFGQCQHTGITLGRREGGLEDFGFFCYKI